MMSRALTTANILDMQVGEVLRCTVVTGLHLLRTKTKKTFYVYYRTKRGVERRPAIGSRWAIGITTARKEARRILACVALGQDPSAEKKLERTGQNLAQVCAVYMSKHGVELKTNKELQRLVDTCVLKHDISRQKVATINSADVETFRVSMRATPYLANRVISLLSSIFTKCELWGWRPLMSNPCRHVDRYAEKSRNRYASTSEMAAIANQLKLHTETKPAQVLFIYLLIYTGARRSEIANARRDWLDGNILRLPDSKTGAKSVYLPAQVMAMLSMVRPKDGTLTGIRPPDKFWRGLRYLAGCWDLHLHDLRHSFASAALTANVSLSQVGGLLGHSSVQTTHGYAHLMPHTAQKAVQVTADCIEQMMENTTNTVSDSHSCRLK